MKELYRKSVIVLCVCMIMVTVSLAGCANAVTEDDTRQDVSTSNGENEQNQTEGAAMLTDAEMVDVSEKIQELESGLSVVSFEGNDGFSAFLQNGGASSDGEVVEYLTKSMFDGAGNLLFKGNPFGCSTIATQNAAGEYLFGRNFDWYNCDALVVVSNPEDAYASISTVNTNFITQGAGGMAAAFSVDNIMTIAALYAPLDGMNEKGLSVSVNMIQDSATIRQDSEKPDITTTTAVRLLLNQAADVEEAIALLDSYDLHASFGYMIHFAVADAKGNSAVIEYIDQQMVVTKTPVVTNFYLSEGEKNGIGTSQSRDRYEILMNTLEENGVMSEVDVRDALESVSKHHYNDGETTEWSAVFNQTKGEAVYFHRENFEKAYRIQLEQ